jgi:hypothetical protein
MSTSAPPPISVQANVPEFAKESQRVEWMRGIRIRNGIPELSTTIEKPAISFHSNQVLVKVKGSQETSSFRLSLTLTQHHKPSQLLV